MRPTAPPQFRTALLALAVLAPALAATASPIYAPTARATHEQSNDAGPGDQFDANLAQQFRYAALFVPIILLIVCVSLILRLILR